jgi:hypothetical protein
MSLRRTTLERTFQADPAAVFDAFSRGISSLSGWSVTRSDPGAGIFEVRTGMTMRSWGEIVHVTIGSAGPGRTTVTVTSRVKMQLVDWGKNKQNAERVLEAGSAVLAAPGPDVGGSPPSIPPPPRLD